jgi:hypothetical protein
MLYEDQHIKDVSQTITKCDLTVESSYFNKGDIWKFNSHTKGWEGNPVFETDFRTYYESLKNRENRTGMATQALPMFPKDFKVIMDYLDGKEAADEISLTR